MSFEIKIRKTGRAGWMDYIEEGRSLHFRWDLNTEGAEVYVPTPYEWDVFCEKSAADWARGRRQEILERLAQEYCRQRAKKAKWRIADHWILISFENYRIHSLLKKLLGHNEQKG